MDKILRGGCWGNSAELSHYTIRNRNTATACGRYVGFRLALDKESAIKIMRGGSWLNNQVGLHAGFRSLNHPDLRHDALSFRLVMVGESDNKTVRGGSWVDEPEFVHIAYWFPSENRDDSLGFRLLEEEYG